jgi:hypothetical protein
LKWTRLRRLCFNPVVYCWIGLLCAYAALYRRLAIADRAVFAFWFNSDTLFPVHFFIDWFRDGYPLSGWRFGIAPCWLPDIPVTALLYALTRNVVLANLLGGLVQFVLLLIGFQLCWRALGLAETRLSDSLTLLAGIAFLLCAAWRINIFYPTIWKLLQPQTHISTLVLVMLAAPLCIRLFRGGLAPRRAKILLALLALLSMGGAMSDPLFIPQLTFAMTIAAMAFVWLGLFRFRAIVPPLAISWVAIFAGRILNRVIFAVTDISAESGFTLDRCLRALHTFLEGAAAEFARLDLLHLSAGLWLLLAFGSFLRLVRRLALRQIPLDDLPGRESMVVFFLLFSALSGLSSAGAIIVGGATGLVELKDYRWSMDHYVHSIFYEATFGWALVLTLLCARLRRPSLTWRPAVVYGSLAAVVLIPAAYAFSVPAAAIPLHLYSPPLVRFLDSQAARNGLQTGAADYWTARLVTLFSRMGLRAYSVLPTFEPNPWVSNRYWYTGTADGSKSAPDYTFVIPEEPFAKNRPAVVQKMGEPDEELAFEGSPRILVYRPSAQAARQARRECVPVLEHARERLTEPRGRLELAAACLNGNIGETVGKTRVKQGFERGLLTFGPYLPVPEGRYTVTMDFQVDHQNLGPAAAWEIGYYCCRPNPAVTLAHGTLEKGRQEVRAQISITSELARRGLEFRVDYLAGERLVFEKITIQREL